MTWKTIYSDGAIFGSLNVMAAGTLQFYESLDATIERVEPIENGTWMNYHITSELGTAILTLRETLCPTVARVLDVAEDQVEGQRIKALYQARTLEGFMPLDK